MRSVTDRRKDGTDRFNETGLGIGIGVIHLKRVSTAPHGNQEDAYSSLNHVVGKRVTQHAVQHHRIHDLFDEGTLGILVRNTDALRMSATDSEAV